MDNKALDLSHLTPAAQAIAMLPNNDERIRHIRTDRWIGYTRARAAIDRLEELYHWPKKQRMPNLLILGPTNNGKSTVIEKFRRDHPQRMLTAKPFDPGNDVLEIIPVVVMQMPSEPSVARFYTVLIASTGPGLAPRIRTADLEYMAVCRLRAVNAHMLVIDELHNLLAGQLNVRREFLNLLRFLGNKLHISIVGVWTRDAYLAIRSDDQLENRFEPVLLPKWQEGEEPRSLIASFVAVLPLRHHSELATADMTKYILARTEGTIGEITKLLTVAAIAAINTGEECITSQTLTRVDYQSPTERRRSFERALL